MAPELASYDGAAHLQQDVELMITGLQSHFQPAPGPPPPGTAQQLVFLRSLKPIDTAVPDGLELHELEIYLEAALPITYGGSALGTRQRASAGNGCGSGISLA